MSDDAILPPAHSPDTPPPKFDRNAFAPEIVAPLAAFNGARPPAPAWFDAALAAEPERSFVDVDGAGIELLTWGEIGKPGLLLLHGNGASADWWSFIAPFFAADWRVVALSWSGMGRSGWREVYGLDQFVREAFGAAQAGGLFEAQQKPVFVGHSFGGMPTVIAAATQGDRLRAAISVDSVIKPPEVVWTAPPPRTGAHKVYPTQAAALARFRLSPPQVCDNPFIADYIARNAMEAVEGGFRWRFDPRVYRRIVDYEISEVLQRPQCPLAIMWGERSRICSPRVREYVTGLVPAGTPQVLIPDADHHVMIDQPLAFVGALRGLLAGWP
jgi:pimeloyl-ACP methyl ester carboxylesterase